MRGYKRLTLARVNRRVAEGEPGMYPDGDGLYLSISRGGTASWVFRYMFGGKSHEMRLGPVRDVGLAHARQLAYDAHRLKRSGVDPLAAKRQGAMVARDKTMTFAQSAKVYITAHQAGWWSAQHKTQIL
jgi:hypothetical protein